MGTRQLMLPGDVVKKSNALTRAKWQVESIYEPRLVALIASRVHMDDEDFAMYEIPISDVTGVQRIDGRTYRQIKSSVRNLMSRIVEIQKSSTHWIAFSIFSKVEYDGDAGVIRARFDPDLKPHFLGLKSHFTQYSLIEFLLLPSTYSQRIFEILKSWSDTSEATISLSDLHEMLNTPDSLRKDFAQFRRRVLDKAYSDIHEKTSLSFEWETIKTGKSVTSIRFTFSKNKKAIAQTKAKAERHTKETEANNKLFMAAIACLNRNGGLCQNQNGPAQQCALCLKLVQNRP